MKKLRIGIMGTRGIPNYYGGFEQFAQYLSLGLAQRGHEVSVYNSSEHPYQQKEWNSVQIIHCKNREHKIGTLGQFFYDLNCINDARKRNFDILLHLGYTSDSIWFWRWPEKTINMVNVDGMEWKRSKYNKLTRQFLKLAESLAAKNADLLIADSQQMQEHFFNAHGRNPFYIPYGAEVFTEINPSVPGKYKLIPHHYFLLIARMEPENNIEMIIRGYLDSRREFPLVVIGNMTNKFGKYICAEYDSPDIKYTGPVFDQPELNNLRYYSAIYFHGHSVGGTNPSLLEAMACGCNIAAHNNIFNKAVLQHEADYFSNSSEVACFINKPLDLLIANKRRQVNIEKILTTYNLEKNIDDYQEAMLNACREKIPVIRTSVAEVA
jgi:glycosyltransferase involved in cell wall biosynthesis